MINKNVKLVAVDMDGTLLDSGKNAPEDFESWVLAHPEIQTVLASGRQYATLSDMFPSLSECLMYVADNGSFVFKQGEMIYSNAMSDEDIRWCIEYFGAMPGLHLILCGARAAYMKHASELVESNGHMYYHSLEFVENLENCIGKDIIAKIAIFIEEYRAEEVYDSLSGIPETIAPVLSGDSWIDVANKSVSKGSAMEAIQQSLGVSREESMAFGDYLNDYDLLLSCGESYAMENAHPKLKGIAKHVTASNDEDGVMKILRQIPSSVEPPQMQ